VPFYDFVCMNCGRKFDQYFSYADYGKKSVACPACHHQQVTRRIGRIRVAKSEERRMSDLASPEALDGLDDDPKKLAGMMRKMSSEMGEDMGSEFNEVVGRLEKGDTPEQIEKEMPDLGQSGMVPPSGMDDLGEDF
jgi:putative FmdB family regulatory protein